MKQVIRYGLFIIVAGIIIFGVGKISNFYIEPREIDNDGLIIGEEVEKYSGKELAKKVKEEKKVSERVFWEDAYKGILQNNKEQYQLLKQGLIDKAKKDRKSLSLRDKRLLIQIIGREMRIDNGWTLEGGIDSENLLDKLIDKLIIKLNKK